MIVAVPRPRDEPGASPSLEPSCPRCEDRGFVLEPDGGAGRAHPCDCRKEALGKRYLKSAGIPERYLACTLESFKVGNQDRAVEEQLLSAREHCRRYLEGFLRPDGRFRADGLFFTGPPGVGKTHLAAAVLRQLILRFKIAGRFVDFTSLVHQIQSTFDPTSPESKRQVLDPVVHAPLLVLDELGAQKPTPWVRDILYLLINTRYSRRLPTLFTSNFPLEDSRGEAPEADEDVRGTSDRAVVGSLGRRGPEPLTLRLQAPLVSRLREMAKPIRLDGVGDYRRDILMHRRRA